MPIDFIGPDGAALHEVRGSASPLLDTACNLFQEIFPGEQRYLPYIRACAQGSHHSHPNTYDHVWLVQQGGEWAGIHIFSYIKTRCFGHSAYIGFTPRFRSHGLGTWLVQQTLAQLDDDSCQFGLDMTIGFLVEVERPIDAKTEAEYHDTERRLQFYRRCGGIFLPVPYIEPVMIEGVDYISSLELKNETPRPMQLILIPSALGASIPNLDLVDFIYGLYLDVYRLPMEHNFVLNSLSYLSGGIYE